MEAFVGTILTFGFNFAPTQWQLCNGQLISISQNQALFALLGTIYGGNGTTTFQLPNLQSRSPIGFGQGTGLSTYVIGQASGAEQVSLTLNNLPTHTHVATFTPSGGGSVNVTLGAATTTTGNTATPANGSVLAANHQATSGVAMWAPSGTATTVNLGGITASGGGGGGTVTNQNTGQGLPTPIMNPYLAVNFSISLFGIFPSRN